MSSPDTPDFWATASSGSVGAALGVIGAILVGVLNRQTPMAALVDARIRTLIKSYEKQISDLQDEIQRLEGKIDALTNALTEERKARGFGL